MGGFDECVEVFDEIFFCEGVCYDSAYCYFVQWCVVVVGIGCQVDFFDLGEYFVDGYCVGVHVIFLWFGMVCRSS